MCICGQLSVFQSGIIVLLVSTAIAQASSFMRAHGVKELFPDYFRIRCDLICPYGYQTDVEGNYVCLCHDPCQDVRCFDGTQCVVDLPKGCMVGEYCRPKATCKDIGLPRPAPTPSQLSVPQADDAATTSSDASRPDRCLLQVTGEAKKCRHTRPRWYFDDVSGTCKRFVGCKTKGNNFRGQRGCEKTCLVKRSFKKNRSRTRLQAVSVAGLALRQTTPTPPQSLSQPIAVCSLQPVPTTTGCKRVRRRWFFDSASGSCRKFRSCRTPGNSFSKKKHCKRRCLSDNKSSRKERRKGRNNMSRSPRH